MNLSFTVWYCYNLQLFVKHKNGRKHENAMEIVEKTLPNNTAIHSIQLYVTSIDSSGLFNETEHPYQTLQCMENWTQSPHHENFFAAHADSALGITVLRDNQHDASAHQNTKLYLQHDSTATFKPISNCEGMPLHNTTSRDHTLGLLEEVDLNMNSCAVWLAFPQSQLQPYQLQQTANSLSLNPVCITSYTYLNRSA